MQLMKLIGLSTTGFGALPVTGFSRFPNRESVAKGFRPKPSLLLEYIFTSLNSLKVKAGSKV